MLARQIYRVLSCSVLMASLGVTTSSHELLGQTPATATQDTLAIPETNDGLPGNGPIRRYDWFQQLWQQRRAVWAERVTADQDAIVFLGDSITQGWGDDIGGTLGDLKVANRGISGDTTRGVLIRLQEDVLALDPTAVVLLIGTNDLEENAEPDVIAANLALILKQLKHHDADMPIIVCAVFPSSETKSRPADKIKEVNRLYGQVVAGEPQVTLLDTWTLFANDQGDAKPEEFPDLLHPNAAGYEKWAAALRPIFATLGFVDTDDPPPALDGNARRLFNGSDLSGWEYQPTTPEMRQARQRWQANDPHAPPWPIVAETIRFEGRSGTPDGRFIAKHGRLIVTTPSEGRKIQQLWTSESFPNDFTLSLEFRATPNADSGVFIRGKQLQCRDFPLAGPYKQLTKFRPLDWNELVIRVQGTTAHCTCNGEVLEEAFAVPSDGSIGLEGDRGQIEYRNIVIR